MYFKQRIESLKTSGKYTDEQIEEIVSLIFDVYFSTLMDSEARKELEELYKKTL